MYLDSKTRRSFLAPFFTNGDLRCWEPRTIKQTLLAILVLSLHMGCNRSDNDALFDAIRAKDSKKVDSLLSKGNVILDPPQQPNQVNKPLAYAAAYGNLDIVKLLLADGADINGQVAYGDVPLIKAAEHDNGDIIQYLIRKGADVNKPNAFGISPFIGFCAGEDTELVRLALKHGGKINEAYAQYTKQNQGKENYTALQIAVARGQADVVRILLDHGGDPTIKTSAGQTCLQLAREAENEQMEAMLK